MNTECAEIDARASSDHCEESDIGSSWILALKVPFWALETGTFGRSEKFLMVATVHCAVKC